MALTRAEFQRLLPAAVGHEAYRVEGDEFVALDGGSRWRIRIAEKPGRPFGPVALPVLTVTLALETVPAAKRQAFVSRFLLGYQRAGG